MLTPVPKVKRIEDNDYLDWIRSLHCCVCGHRPPSEPHHVSEKGKGSMGSKTDDTRAIPACNYHHREAHVSGRNTFAEERKIEYESLIKGLQDLYKEILNGN